MGVIADIKNQIEKLQQRLQTIQDRCSHPELVRVGSGGDVAGSEPSSWRNCACSLCEKTWTEDQ